MLASPEKQVSVTSVKNVVQNSSMRSLPMWRADAALGNLLRRADADADADADAESELTQYSKQLCNPSRNFASNPLRNL